MRGETWYVVQDHQNGRYFRISEAARAVLARLDGRHSVADIAGLLAKHLGAQRPGRGEIVRLLVQLHHADLLATPLPPDLAELDRRAETQARRQFWGRLRNPLALRVPLWDPDRFLNATVGWVRAMCHPAMLLALLAIVVTGAAQAAMHAGALASNVADRVFAADNVALMMLVYPLAKLVHEAGHAYAVKLGGGEVHEVGVMLLVLFPVPYVNASSSAAFPDAWRRVAVSAAGMMMELLLAALAAIAWVSLDPGTLRAAALDVMVLCGVSTLVFNGNPLLRFDGYYVLSDLVGVPNLDTRARQQLLFVLRRFVLGMRGETSAVEVQGEGRWLIGFGLVSLVYRIVMVLTIGLLVATKMFMLGVALALASVAQMLIWPVLRALHFLISGSALAGRRLRAWLGAGGAALLVTLLLFVVRLPYALVAPGVVWVPAEAIVRAGAEGFVTDIAAPPGSAVAPGSRLFTLDDPVARAETDVLAAEAAVQQARYNAANQLDRVQARLLENQVGRARAALERARERVGGLDVVAQHAGRFVVPNAATLVGRFVHKGDVLGYVLGGADIGVRVVVSQAELDLVRARTTHVDVLLAEAMERALPARVQRETPSALERPPAPALSPEGGGPMLVDPGSPGHDRPLDRWFAFDLALAPEDAATISRIGAHASARFDLGGEPLAWRLLLWGRQVILRTLNI
jgi:putative peptide zinc metalloprotease protein